MFLAKSGRLHISFIVFKRVFICSMPLSHDLIPLSERVIITFVFSFRKAILLQ